MSPFPSFLGNGMFGSGLKACVMKPNAWVWTDYWLWQVRRSNQSILKKINPEYSLEGLMLKLKLQYLGHLMRRADSLEKFLIWERLKVGGEGDYRGWDGWVTSPTQWKWVWASSESWWWTGRPGKDKEVYRVTKSRTQLSDWMATMTKVEVLWTSISPCVKWE